MNARGNGTARGRDCKKASPVRSQAANVRHFALAAPATNFDGPRLRYGGKVVGVFGVDANDVKGVRKLVRASIRTGQLQFPHSIKSDACR